jgi:hypothetical protein
MAQGRRRVERRDRYRHAGLSRARRSWQRRGHA